MIRDDESRPLVEKWLEGVEIRSVSFHSCLTEGKRENGWRTFIPPTEFSMTIHGRRCDDDES